MRRYELMLVLRPDIPEERSQAVLERTTRAIAAGEGQIVKVSPWGRRRLAYPIGQFREASYHIIVFEAPGEAVAEVERGLRITEDVLRYLVTRTEAPASTRRASNRLEEAAPEGDLEAPPEEDTEVVGEIIDESESEAAPAAID